MYIMTALVTGSIVYAGTRAYRKYRQRRTTAWLLEDGRYVETTATVVEEPDLNQIEHRINQNLNMATFSLGITAAGVLLYTPLVLVSVPFNLYDAIKIFEDTWDMVLKRGPLFTVLVSSSVVTISLLSDFYLLTAVVEWLYFLNQKLVVMLLRSELGSFIMQSGQTGPVVEAYAL